MTATALSSSAALTAHTRLALPESGRSRQAARLGGVAIGVALLLHLLLGAVLFVHRRAVPVPPPSQPPSVPIELEVQNNTGIASDKSVGGDKGTTNSQAKPSPVTPAAAPPAPPTPQKQDTPDLPKAADGEVAPPEPAPAATPRQTPDTQAPAQPTVADTTPTQDQTPPTDDPAPDIRLADGQDDGVAGGSATVPAKADPKLPNRLPAYPLQAAMHGEQGEVTMFIHVSPEGATSVVIANSSGSQTLDATALKAVRRWKFKPATKDGKPIASDVPAALNFVLHH